MVIGEKLTYYGMVTGVALTTVPLALGIMTTSPRAILNTVVLVALKFFIKIFLKRTYQVNPSYNLTNTHVWKIVYKCARIGLPLAIICGSANYLLKRYYPTPQSKEPK